MENLIREKLLTVQTGTLNVVQALGGLQLLLKEITQKSQDQFDELCSCDVILKFIIRQAEETADTLLTIQ